MNHEEHVGLIAAGVARGSGGVWADFGSGEGAFTLALRDLAGPAVEIWSVERERWSLEAQQAAFARRFPATALHLVRGDFTAPLDLPPLDGILAANAIHFVRDQAALLRAWRGYLRPDGGRLIVVEYDAGSGNRWVPHPLSLAALPAVARAAGFGAPVLLGSRPSRFLNRIYAASLAPVGAATDPPDGA